MSYIILISVFAIYLWTLFPTVAPYRDSGEMATVIKTLGIAHPPGYPLYILLGKIFISILRIGNIAYRLNVLSAIFSVLTILLVIEILKRLLKENIKNYLYFVPVILATSYLQWYLSLVSEMYTFNTFFVALLISVFLTDNFYLFFFISGLSLGCRLDIMFVIIPFSIYLIFKNYRKIFIYALFFVLGFSVYFYLPLRSIKAPIFDWNHPANFKNFYSTLTRKTHGGTLDLLATNYPPGANFIPDIFFFLKRFFDGFAYFGIIFALIGVVKLFKINKHLAVSLLFSFLLSGPVFIYLANMPPNPHALAILEAHFLMPGVIFAIWLSVGFFYILNKIAQRSILLSLPIFLVFINLFQNFPEINKRNNFFTYDYMKNILRPIERNSILVMKEDVQLFSVWYSQFVNNYRRDIATISQGLSGSKWYKDMVKKVHQDIILCSLKTKDDWQQFIRLNSKKPIFSSGDVELPNLSIEYYPAGLSTQLGGSKTSNISLKVLDELYVYRGKFRYESYKEFFTPDLIEEYSKANFSLGNYYLKQNNYKLAKKYFLRSSYYKKNFPITYFQLGYINFLENDYKNAEKYYLYAEKEYIFTLELAEKYNSLEDLKVGLKNDLADVYLHLGVVSEKLGNDPRAFEYYSKSIDINPVLTKAYFNRAVIYWKKSDWKNVIKELEQALRIDPNYQEARYYLEKAKYNLLRETQGRKNKLF
ncbi:MAG: protein O-mannosyl-transferase family [Endomicrobiia bacterium]